eukprot:TRINITY_DN3284_c0_g1_i1.p1 TRINITY_DN3284_c0_g1~~TRINITY_DN3284_c0_g1_i1.p1  ORF type:complete len:753 (-),score=212.38 TRINITY_DN3284_c0_g1_i1:210-2468(-)
MDASRLTPRASPRPSSDGKTPDGAGREDVGMRPVSATNGGTPPPASPSPATAAGRSRRAGSAASADRPRPTSGRGASPLEEALAAKAAKAVDDETTIAEDEAAEEADDEETARLADEADMPLEELLRLQGVDVDAYANDDANYAASDSSDDSTSSGSDTDGSASGSDDSAGMDTGSNTPDAADPTPPTAQLAPADAACASGLAAATSNGVASIGRPRSPPTPSPAGPQQPASPKRAPPAAADCTPADPASGAAPNGVLSGLGLEDTVAEYVKSRGAGDKPPAAAPMAGARPAPEAAAAAVSATSKGAAAAPPLPEAAAVVGTPAPSGALPGRALSTAPPAVERAVAAVEPAAAAAAAAPAAGAPPPAIAGAGSVPPKATVTAPGPSLPAGTVGATPMDVSPAVVIPAAAPSAAGANGGLVASATLVPAGRGGPLADGAAADGEPTYTVDEPSALLRGGHLRSYQRAGLDWLAALYAKKLNGVLADDMGLGKTIMTIALFAHLALEHQLWGPHLIVVPTSVMLNWEIEFKRWCPAFKVISYYGSLKERRAKRRGWGVPNAVHVVITSYSLAVADAAVLRRMRWAYLVLDEAHHIKNFESLRWQTLVSYKSQRRLLLTGTPLQNSVMELWALLHFLMPDVFHSHAQFKEWFSVPLDSAAAAKSTELVRPGDGTGLAGATASGEAAAAGVVGRLHTVLRPSFCAASRATWRRGCRPRRSTSCGYRCLVASGSCTRTTWRAVIRRQRSPAPTTSRC